MKSDQIEFKGYYYDGDKLLTKSQNSTYYINTLPASYFVIFANIEYMKINGKVY